MEWGGVDLLCVGTHAHSHPKAFEGLFAESRPPPLCGPSPACGSRGRLAVPRSGLRVQMPTPESCTGSGLSPGAGLGTARGRLADLRGAAERAVPGAGHGVLERRDEQ